MQNDLLSMGISIAAVVAGMGEVRAKKGRGLGMVVNDPSAESIEKTLEEKYVSVATKIYR